MEVELWRCDMHVVERMRMCRIIEKMEEQKEYSKRLGLENNSYYKGAPIINQKKRGHVL